MKKFFGALVLLVSLVACKQEKHADKVKPSTIKLYSAAVKDTFSVFVSVPDEPGSKNKTYPVVYLLDANLYFDIMASTF